jgi:hypothetical protein
VIIGVAGFPEASAFDVIKRLFPNSTHITLPAAYVLQTPEIVPMIPEFLEGVKIAAERIVAGEEIDIELEDRINVVFPLNVKDEIIKRHNKMSENITPSG